MFFKWNYRIQETCSRYVLNYYLGGYNAAKGRQKMLVKPMLFSRQFSRCLSLSTFEGKKDRFNGLTVDFSKENCDVSTFNKQLEDSLEKWKGEGRRCIWFSVNISDASIIPVLAKKGFNFHHAREGSVMMYKWLPTDNGPNLPPPCHTNLGVGAMVFNQKNQILAVSEKHYEYPHWKLPGGYVERGEDIIDAGKREVREETGVESEFQSLVTFRHTHNMMYGNSDIYFLLMMTATSEKINISHREVKDCRWMLIEEYTSHPHVHEWNRTVVRRALDLKSRKLKLDLTKKTVNWAQNQRVMSFLMLEDCQS